jgi:hypothetical protein
MQLTYNQKTRVSWSLHHHNHSELVVSMRRRFSSLHVCSELARSVARGRGHVVTSKQLR